MFDEIYQRRSTEYIDKGAFLQTVNEVIRWQGGENEIFTILISKAKDDLKVRSATTLDCLISPDFLCAEEARQTSLGGD